MGMIVKQVQRSKETWSGGVAIVHRESIKITEWTSHIFITFEHIAVAVTAGSHSNRMIVIYRPPPFEVNKFTESKFIDEFSDFWG